MRGRTKNYVGRLEMTEVALKTLIKQLELNSPYMMYKEISDHYSVYVRKNNYKVDFAWYLVQPLLKRSSERRILG